MLMTEKGGGGQVARSPPGTNRWRRIWFDIHLQSSDCTLHPALFSALWVQSKTALLKILDTGLTCEVIFDFNFAGDDRDLHLKAACVIPQSRTFEWIKPLMDVSITLFAQNSPHTQWLFHWNCYDLNMLDRCLLDQNPTMLWVNCEEKSLACCSKFCAEVIRIQLLFSF